MWDDVRVWIAVAAIIAGFTWRYLGNSELRQNVKAGLSWFRAMLRAHFFWIVYSPLLLIAILLLNVLSALTLTSALVIYALWVTIWCIHAVTRTRRISTVAVCRLGDRASESGHDGLAYVRYSDGDARRELHEGAFVRRTDYSKRSLYIYFRIRSDIVQHFQRGPCIALVEFLDECESAFDLQYDSTDRQHANRYYKETDPHTCLGAGGWQLATFNIADPAFAQRQNNGSDFRLRIAPNVDPSKTYPDLVVRKVVCVALID